MKARCGRRAFTMMELAIVIVVAGILVAIGVPIFSTLTDEARWSEGKAAMGAVRTKLRLYGVANGIGEINGGAAATGLSWSEFADVVALDAADLGHIRYFGADNFELDIDATPSGQPMSFVIRLGGAGSGIGTERSGAPRGILELDNAGLFTGPYDPE